MPKYLNMILVFLKKIWKNYPLITSTVLVIISILTYFGITPSKENSENLQLTIFVTNSDGNVAIENEGRLNTSLGNRSLNEPIGTHGRTNFPDITENNIGDTFKIGIKAEGWQIIGKNKFVLEGKPINVIVERDKALGIIKGTVRSREGQSFIDSAMIMVNSDTTVYSNKQGVFKIILPSSMHIRNLDERYKLIIVKKGYKNHEELYSPLSSDANILLDKWDLQ